MSDLISRQAAIDAVLHHGEIENDYTDLYYDGYCDGVYDSADILKDLPSAQLHDMLREFYFAPTEDVEPVRHGHWEGKTYKCSLCGKWVDPLQGNADMNYCPNCGARMDGEEQENE